MEEQIKQANPTLHRYLFTVTTFSKLLALSLFIILPFVGFYLGMQYQQKITVSAPVVSEVQKTATPTPTLIPNQTGCSTDNDCQNGAKCMTVGPIIANRTPHKVCVGKGQAIPL
jgi:hypothetical protein